MGSGTKAGAVNARTFDGVPFDLHLLHLALLYFIDKVGVVDGLTPGVFGPKLLNTVISTIAMTTQRMRFFARSFKPAPRFIESYAALQQHAVGASKAWL